MLQSVAAMAIGIAAGFAIIVPFGGLRAGQAELSDRPGTIVRCDIMGCKVTRTAQPGT